MNGRDPLEPSEDIGDRDNPGGPGSTEVLPEPTPDEIYIPGGGVPTDPGSSPSEH